MTAETFVLDSPASLPDVARHPAPWQLRASAYAVLVKLPADTSDEAWFVPPSLRGKRRSQLGIMLYVDYHSADCGPYRELIGACTSFDFGDKQLPSITRIYVSTFDSVVNGRANWGIPKDRADFEAETTGKNAQRITVRRDARELARFELQGRGPALPATTAMLLPAWRTVAQHWQGCEYRIVLAAKGKARLARVIDWRFAADLFPDLARGSVLTAVQLPTFEMTFPVATIKPLADDKP
jgi:hypothetical protein